MRARAALPCTSLAVHAHCTHTLRAVHHAGWACTTFTLYHMCDNTDGKHARRTGKTSKFGCVL